MSVVDLQKRIKELQERVQELEAELYREVAKDMQKLRERPTEYWSHRSARSAVPVRDPGGSRNTR